MNEATPPNLTGDTVIKNVEVRLEEALLASVTAATDVMLVYLDPAFNFVWVNQAYADSCHYQPAEMIGKNHFALYPDQENEAIFRRVRDTGESVFFKDRPFSFPDQPERGVTYWDWSLTAVRRGGQVDGLVFSLRETTPYVRALQAQQESRARYQRLFEHMGEGLAVLEILGVESLETFDLRYIDVNPAFDQLTGLRREAVVGRRLRELLPDLEQSWFEQYHRVALTGEPLHCEKHVGSLGRWLDIHAYQPQPGQIAVLFNDVTRRRAADEALRLAKAEAERANNAKSRFLAAASHDLRQPLAALGIYASALQGEVTAAGEPLLANMKDCIASLGALLHDLLDLSKLEAGVVEPVAGHFAVADLFARLESVHAPDALAKGLVLRFVPSRWAIHADRVLLQRIVGNLVANAVRYTERGSILVGCRRQGGKRWIEVRDSGIGIPPDKTAEIFEEFRQLGDSASTRGSGLGLAIVARTAALLGLEVRVRSAPGRGSLFAVEIPSGESLVDAPPPAMPAAGYRPLRVALVEDNPDVRAALVHALEGAGNTVFAAATGRALIEGLAAFRPDVLVADYRLGRDETGIEAIGAARRALVGELPALLLTGDTDPRLVRSLADSGIVVLHKPADFETLQAYLEHLTWQGVSGR